MDELNPNHPATVTARDNWHKIAGLLMMHFGATKVTIPPAEIARLDGLNIAIRFDDVKGIEVFILEDREMAKKLARKEGGLPV